MKKSIALLLLLLVCLLSCMLPLRYGLKQAAKVVMQHRMHGPEQAEPSILIAAADLASAKWEDDHEFRLGGQMYDVAGIEYHNGLKYYRCITDELEMRIERRADECTGAVSGREQHKGQGRIAEALLDWLQGLYFRPVQQQNIFPLSGAKHTFFAGAEHAVEDPFPDSRIIPPDAGATRA